MNETINKAIKECKGRENLAKACGVSLMTVSNWLHGSGISGRYIKPISDATKGVVTIDEILQSLSEN